MDFGCNNCQTDESLSKPRLITVAYEEDRLRFYERNNFSVRTVYSTRLKIIIILIIKSSQRKLGYSELSATEI